MPTPPTRCATSIIWGLRPVQSADDRAAALGMTISTSTPCCRSSWRPRSAWMNRSATGAMRWPRLRWSPAASSTSRSAAWADSPKPSRYTTSAQERGIPVWCGGMLEAGIGRAHNIALSSLPNFTLPGDVSASKRYWTEDIIEPEVEVSAQGFIKIPDAPGLRLSLAEPTSLRNSPCVNRRCAQSTVAAR